MAEMAHGEELEERLPSFEYHILRDRAGEGFVIAQEGPERVLYWLAGESLAGVADGHKVRDEGAGGAGFAQDSGGRVMVPLPAE